MNKEIEVFVTNRVWGDDPHADLETARKLNSDLVVEAEQKIRRIYLNFIRDNFENNQTVREIIESSEQPDLFNVLNEHFADFCRSESKEIFEECLKEIITELESYKKNPGSMYVIDSSTGKTVTQFNEGMVYQPPDYTGEDGVVRKSKKILHPSISVPLTISAYETAKKKEFLDKKELSTAMTYLKNPNSIIDSAIEILERNGYHSVDFIKSYTSLNIEFGKEHVSTLQSINPMFHRHVSLGAVLANRIMSALNGLTNYRIMSCESKTNSKTSWHSAVVLIQNA